MILGVGSNGAFVEQSIGQSKGTFNTNISITNLIAHPEGQKQRKIHVTMFEKLLQINNVVMLLCSCYELRFLGMDRGTSGSDFLVTNGGDSCPGSLITFI